MVGAANSDSARISFFGSTKGEQNRIWEWFFGSITDSRPRPLSSTPPKARDSGARTRARGKQKGGILKKKERKTAGGKSE
ncbi:hypothetical protein RND71_036932 [Anisodus tanguticus]|uniref:Uncharacterized protein n=1 Tax=Anisodus tanguticus TaxID=243964 RepID=A0AAE1UT66_9SOLA|nr:hypothetical protein RND71_036932 [Anisodus tanguticus]